MRSRWLGFIVAALVLGISLWAFPQLPPTVPSHWNLHGDVDAYSSRASAMLLMPVMIVVLRLLLSLLPKIDPLGKNYEGFTDTFWLMINTVLLFMAAIHLVMIANALGFTVPPARLIPIAAGLMCIFLGNVMGRLKPNWFFGIRTPWTLSSETVWRKTHRTAGWLLVLGGVPVGLVGFAPRAAAMPLMAAVLGFVLAVPVVYSFILWRAERRGVAP